MPTKSLRDGIMFLPRYFAQPRLTLRYPYTRPTGNASTLHSPRGGKFRNPTPNTFLAEGMA